MSNKTRSILKGIAIALVVLAVIMHIKPGLIPGIGIYRFWMVVTGFALLLVSSK